MSLEAGNLAEVFDPDGGVPARVAEALERLATVNLLLVAGSDARRSGWAEPAAVALARAWSARGAGVVLADLCLDDPVLHDAAGVANDEGVSDIFLFGASLERAVRPTGVEGLSFLPAGPHTPDPEAVVTDPAWDRILAAASDAGAPLWMYIPATAAGLEQLAERVGHAVVLASSAESVEVAGSLPASCAVAAVLVQGEVLPAGRVPDSAAGPADGAEEDRPAMANESTPGEVPETQAVDREAISATVEAWLASFDVPGDAPEQEVADSPAGVRSADSDDAGASRPPPAAPPVAVESLPDPAAEACAREEVLLGASDGKRGRGGRRTVVWVVAAVVLLGVTAAAGWFLLGP